MSKFLKVQQGILGLSPGEYQRFCADYIIKKKRYENMHDIGSKEGSIKQLKEFQILIILMKMVYIL